MDKKIVGIVYAYDANDEYKAVVDCGFKWIRVGIPFPWEDKMEGKLSNRYLKAKETCKEATADGLSIMGATFGMGAYMINREDKSDTETKWRDSIPDFAGVKGSDEYYANIRKAAEFMCEDLKGLVHGLWQCMNEIDIPTFAGTYSDDIVSDTARALADGIVKADPKAMCGINLSHYHDDALKIADLVYRDGHNFKYLGDDQYFGSWQSKDVDAWIEVIDIFYARYGLPVLVNEWGYSSGGKVAPERPDPKILPLGWPDVCYLKSWFNQVEGGHTPEVQAEYLRKGLKIFADHPHVLGSFMFCWKDAVHCYHCGQTECPAECYWGIVDSDSKPKVSYHVVKDAIKEYY